MTNQMFVWSLEKIPMYGAGDYQRCLVIYINRLRIAVEAILELCGLLYEVFRSLSRVR